MLSELNEMMQTTKATLSISGVTFFSGIAAFIDIIPAFTAIAGLILAIYTLRSSRRRDKRETSAKKRDEERKQELHKLKVDILKREINETGR